MNVLRNPNRSCCIGGPLSLGHPLDTARAKVCNQRPGVLSQLRVPTSVDQNSSREMPAGLGEPSFYLVQSSGAALELIPQTKLHHTGGSQQRSIFSKLRRRDIFIQIRL